MPQPLQDKNISINPFTQKIHLGSSAPAEIQMNVLNNGASSRQDGNVTILLKDELGAIIDQKSMTYVLLPKGGTSPNIPEFPSVIIVAISLVVSALAISLFKRKKTKLHS